MIETDELIVEASKVTEIVDVAHASETKDATEINDEFCPDGAYLVDKADRKEVVFTFLSDYGEEDILDSFPEVFPGIFAELVSRVRVAPRSAETFSWPAMDPVNTEVFGNIRRILAHAKGGPRFPCLRTQEP